MALGAFVLVAPLIALWTPGDGIKLVLDGRADEWHRQGISLFSATEASRNPSLNLTSFAAHLFSDELGLWAEVEGGLFSDPTGYDSVHVFVDADASATTGYRYAGLGADYRVDVGGWRAQVAYAHLYRFDSLDQEDWWGWVPFARPQFARSDRALEVAVPAEDLQGLVSTFLAAFVVEGNDGDGSASAVAVGDGPNAIRAWLDPVAEVVEVGDEIAVLTVLLEGVGECQITGVDFDPVGLVAFRPLRFPVVVSAGAAVRLPVALSAVGGSQPGDAIRVLVENVNARCPVTLNAAATSAYLGVVPEEKRVDGLFADWRSDSAPTARSAPSNPNVDLVAYGVEGGAFATYVYAGVAGRALAGARIPFFERPPQLPSDSEDASGFAHVSGPRRSVEDHLVAWIDVDPAERTGEPLGSLSADWRVEVSGRRGTVTSALAFPWEGEGWSVNGASVDVAVSGNALELSVGGPAIDPLAVLDLRDWRGIGETTAFPPAGTRAQLLPKMPVVWPTIEWPPWFAPRATDPDDGLDPAVEILEVHAYNYLPIHLFVRIVLEASSPGLRDHTWWLYLDAGPPTDGNNDWLIAEMSGSWAVCSYGWDSANGDWGTAGTGCDVADSIRDTDSGSAVRVVANCIGTRGCIDFAIQRSDYPGLGWNPRITVASDIVEDLDLLGSLERNPASAPGGCSVPEFDDCSVPTVLEIPEFSGPAVLIAVLIPALVVLRRVRSNNPSSSRRRSRTVEPVRWAIPVVVLTVVHADGAAWFHVQVPLASPDPVHEEFLLTVGTAESAS